LPRALITGVTGQDGSYLAELLLTRGYEVHGLSRDPDGPHPNLAAAGDVELHRGSLSDAEDVQAAVAGSRPDEVYNLAAFSSVGRSWQQPGLAADVNFRGVERVLAAVEELAPKARILQASSSDMFGPGSPVPQDEHTPFAPESPYARAKLAAHGLVEAARRRGLHASAAILFNHESPRRGLDFVTRKVTRAAAAIRLGLESELRLGSLAARRDWGYAPEYVEAMWLMLQRPQPGDLVIGSGRSHAVSDFVAAAFARVGLDAGAHVRIDAEHVRPAEIGELRADASRAERELGWRAQTDLEGLVGLMVDADLEALRAAAAERAG
jgi:GDPmannose 4,6-dehydratase